MYSLEGKDKSCPCAFVCNWAPRHEGILGVEV